MGTISEHIHTLPKKLLNTNRISVVLYDRRLDYYLYLFRINMKEKRCIALNGPSNTYPEYDFIELTTLDFYQLDNYYGYCFLIHNDPNIEMDYRELKRILESK